MPDRLNADQIKLYGGLELNALSAMEALPAGVFEGARLTSAGTEIYDLNGEILFHRVPVTRGRTRVGFADVAANPALGATWLAVSSGPDWNERAIIEEATAAARRRQRSLRFDATRIVAFSYPKIGVQFLSGNQEVMLLEWGSWEPVPAKPIGARNPLEPGHFERWSLLDEMPSATRRANARKLEERIGLWDEARRNRRFDATVIDRAAFTRIVQRIELSQSWEIHYSSRATDHHPCYELRGQETSVWCVGASVQMLLDFYRYGYSQDRIAQELGLGTKASPNGLPYSRVGDVVTVLEKLSSNALDATMVTGPTWTTFRDEVAANRPLISFIPGHSRTVAGYFRSLIALTTQLPFRGLLVYDPWPPNVGVVTRWENFDTQTYQFAYTARVTLA